MQASKLQRWRFLPRKSSSGQKSRRLPKAPVMYEENNSSDDDTDGDTVNVMEKLKTPRRVVSSLINVSSGARVQQLLRSAPVPDDISLPLSSTTSHERQATVTAVAAECDAAHTAAVRRAYANANVH